MGESEGIFGGFGSILQPLKYPPTVPTQWLCYGYFWFRACIGLVPPGTGPVLMVPNWYWLGPCIPFLYQPVYPALCTCSPARAANELRAALNLLGFLLLWWCQASKRTSRELVKRDQPRRETWKFQKLFVTDHMRERPGQQERGRSRLKWF